MRADEQAMLIAAACGFPFFVNGGNLTNRQGAIYALAEWANSCERRLLGMSCGYVLPRGRHRVWAESIVGRCRFLMRPGGWCGAILLPAQAGVTRTGRDAESGSVGAADSTRSPEGMRPETPSSSPITNTGDVL